MLHFLITYRCSTLFFLSVFFKYNQQSFNPPPPPCTPGQDTFVFKMQTDNSGEDITWKVQVKESSGFEDYFGRGTEYGNTYGNNTRYKEQYCFPPRGQW